MENKKAHILWNLNNDLLKLEKTKKIFKQDFIYDNLISNMHQLKKYKLEINEECINYFINIENNFPERHKNFIEFYEKLKAFPSKNIKDLKTSLDSNTTLAFTQQFTFFYCCKYKTPFFFKPQYYFPKLVELQFNEIIFWILNVELQEKNTKKNSNHFLVYVKEIQKKKNNEDIKEVLILLFLKIIKHVKYGKNS